MTAKKHARVLQDVSKDTQAQANTPDLTGLTARFSRYVTEGEIARNKAGNVGIYTLAMFVSTGHIKRVHLQNAAKATDATVKRDAMLAIAHVMGATEKNTKGAETVTPVFRSALSRILAPAYLVSTPENINDLELTKDDNLIIREEWIVATPKIAGRKEMLDGTKGRSVAEFSRIAAQTLKWTNGATGAQSTRSGPFTIKNTVEFLVNALTVNGVPALSEEVRDELALLFAIIPEVLPDAKKRADALGDVDVKTAHGTLVRMQAKHDAKKAEAGAQAAANAKKASANAQKVA